MKKFISIISIALGVSSAWATIITDDFNRPDSGMSSNGNIIGADWESSRTTGQWGIVDQRVVANMIEASSVLYNTSLETVSGSGVFFEVSLDVKALGSYWGGIAFNYQNPTNFYYFRYKGDAANYQMYRVVDNVHQSFVNSTIAGTFAANTNYTLTVVSSNAYEFAYEIRETGGAVVVSGTTTDANASFTGGYAGVLQTSTGSGRHSFDNFSLEVGSLSPVTDDFNRPDGGMNSTGATVGPDWHSSRTTGQWGIVDQRVVANMVEANSVLYNSVLETISGNGTNFTASLDVKAFGAYWAGLAFNYQNPTNFYYFRYKGAASDYQMYRMEDGASVKLFGVTISGVFATNTDYTLTVASSNAYEFAYEIKETGGAVLASGTTTDSASLFTGGYAGILQTSTGADRNSFDNFSVTVGPEIIPGYAGWAAGWGVDIGVETNDYDLDGLLNVYEYGLGGDPTNSSDQGTSPEFAIVDGGGSNVFNYVYPQRSDPDSGLSYSLALRVDLMLGDWATNTGYVVTGTNVTGGTLDFVTNVTDTVDGQKFIRLIIE